jgi:hypothetical protein
MPNRRKDGPPSSFNAQEAANSAQYFVDMVRKFDPNRRDRQWDAFQELIRESGAFPPRRSIFSRLFKRG